MDAPKQPILKSYDSRKFGYDIYIRDFNADWYNDHPWLEYSVEAKIASYYACKTYIGKNFTFSNWKKPEHLMKHHKSQDHGVAMAKWIAFRENKRKNTSVAKQLDNQHRVEVQHYREYLRVIIECLVFTAQQNIAQRGHREDHQDIVLMLDINCGNFLELLHMRCRDIPWLEDNLKFQLKHHHQWTTWNIQNELLQISADLILARVQNEIGDSMYSIIMDKTSDISKTEQVFLCLSFVHEGVKKDVFVGFF